MSKEGLLVRFIPAVPEVPLWYTPHEGPSSASRNSWKLAVSGRKLEGSHIPFYCYFDEYKGKWDNNVQSMWNT